MDKQVNKHKLPLKLRLITIASLTLVLFLLMLLAGHPAIVEHYYSNGIYPAICHIFHPVFNIFPFSVGDLLYSAVICYFIYLLARLVMLAAKRKFRLAGIFALEVIIGIQSAIIVFYLFWGMNYYRSPAAKRLNVADSGYSAADLKLVTSMLIDSANACRARVNDADLKQGNKTIYKTAVQAVNALSDRSAGFLTYSPAIKPSLLTPLLNYIGTSGYYNPFTSEAQINYQMPVFLRPFVACHEMSHQMGFGPEDEANFAGFLAGIQSHDHLLRYSAYYLGVQEFMFALRGQDSVARKELKTHISLPVLNDFKSERKYWVSFEGKAGVLSSFFYDNFLKANNQPQGLRNYNRMVRLVLGWYKKNNMIH
jgi:hypothetical protein